MYHLIRSILNELAITVAALGLVVHSAFCQPPPMSFTYITRENGLSNSSVETICQDARGFLWFGTTDGLNRYDGNKIVVYRNHPQNKGSISDNFVHFIFKDSKGNLWIGTANGLNKFDPFGNKFQRFNIPSGSADESSNRIITIVEDTDRRLWVGTGSGSIARLNDEGTALVEYLQPRHNSNSGSPKVNCILNRDNGVLWVGTDAGLKIFDTKRLQFIQADPKITTALNTKIRTLNRSRSGVLWVGTEEKGVFSIDEKLANIRQYRHSDQDAGSLGSDRIISMMVDSKDRLLVGTVNGGLNVLDGRHNGFIKYSNDPLLPGTLSQRTVAAIYEDKQHNIWIGTPRGGINVVNMQAENFKHIQKTAGRFSLSNNDVRSIYEDREDMIWIGTDGGGLNKFDRKTGAFVSYAHNPSNSNSIGSNAVLSIIQDHAGRMWVGTFDGGLNLFDPKTGLFKRFLHDAKNPYSIASNMVECVFEDSQKGLWVCTYNGGVQRFDPETGKFSSIGKSEQPGKKLWGTKILTMNKDRKGNLWIATVDSGLNKYNPRTGLFEHYFTNTRNPDLATVFVDSQGSVWVGKKNLLLYNERQNTFSPAAGSNKIPEEFVKAIIETRPHQLWLSTGNGILFFDSRTHAYKKYNPLQDSQGPEYEVNAALKAHDGTIFLGSTVGLTIFHPDSIRLNNYVPPVYLTGFQLFNKAIGPGPNSVLRSDISQTKKLALSHEQSSFSFEFAALNFIRPEKNGYAYKLEGFDPDWIYINNQQRASYTNISPGKYTFRVKAANNDGVWNTNGTAIEIEILPPFYRTWWFILLSAALIIALLVWLYRFKRALDFKAIKEKQREDLHQSQLQFFTNITHEFRTPLSLILAPLEKLTEKEVDPNRHEHLNLIQKNANRLLRFVNELMDFRKLQSGLFKLQVSKHASILNLKELAEEFTTTARSKNIAYKINLESHNDSGFWYDSYILEKILLNLLNNAFRYTQAGGEISCDQITDIADHKSSFSNHIAIMHPEKLKKGLFLRVRDTGIGISQDSLNEIFERYYQVSNAHLGSGVGLAFVKSLVELHKGDIYVFSDKEIGSEFIIALACSEMDYSQDEKSAAPDSAPGIAKSAYMGLEHIDAPAGQLNADESMLNKSTVSEYILVVEDNTEVRNFLKASLEGRYHIATAENGIDGYEIARKIMPDLIISDVMMPLMDGNLFCNQIKNDIETSHIPFIMLTAKDSLESQIEGTSSGADIYLTKPFSVNLLLLTISNIFENRRKLKQRYINDYLSEATDLVHSTKDRAFIEKLVQVIDSKLTDPDLDIEQIAREMGMSQSKIYQKLKSISGQSIVEFIRSHRLKKATQILATEDVTINEVIFRVGIQTASYFTKIFKKEYGKTPSEFLNEIRNRV